jgi:hypothetical protein
VKWILLAKAQSDVVARRASLSAPVRFLPRLLLLSGLPRGSLIAMVDRLGRLGDNNPGIDTQYSRLMSPLGSNEWDVGRVGTRRALARRLLGRLDSYFRLYDVRTSKVETSFRFVEWLSQQCARNPTTKQRKVKAAGSTSPTSSEKHAAKFDQIEDSELCTLSEGFEWQDSSFELTDLKKEVSHAAPTNATEISDFRRLLEYSVAAQQYAALDRWLVWFTRVRSTLHEAIPVPSQVDIAIAFLQTALVSYVTLCGFSFSLRQYLMLLLLEVLS